MSDAERYRYDDFTRENYSRLLGLAKQRYPFRTFSTYQPAERFVIWRHDVDFSPQGAVRFAEREHAAGVAATYFILLHADCYNALEREVTGCIRSLVALGHEIGLHFDLDYYGDGSGDDRLDARLANERSILEDIAGAPCRAFSFHNPDARVARYRAAEYAGLVNAGADYFFREVGFCSDSNGYWRSRRLEDVLREAAEPRLQVLTHPEMWQEAPMSPQRRIYRCIDGRAERCRERYAQLLERHGRANIE